MRMRMMRSTCGSTCAMASRTVAPLPCNNFTFGSRRVQTTRMQAGRLAPWRTKGSWINSPSSSSSSSPAVSVTRPRVAAPKALVDSQQQENSETDSHALKLNIQGRHLKVTEALRGHVETQVEKATMHLMLHHHDVNRGKNAPISRVDVRLSARGGPKHQTKGPQLQRAEVTVFTTIGTVRAEVETDNAYNAIDEAGRTVERKLRKLKEKAIAKGVWNGHGVRPKYKKKKAARDSLGDVGGEDVDAEEVFISDYDEEAMALLEEEASMRWETESAVEDMLASEASAPAMSQQEQDLKIYRKKEVDLIPMSIEDAVESLQFLGHDFFMFLDKAEGEIKVVYKRDVAGYGVLSPKFPPSAK